MSPPLPKRLQLGFSGASGCTIGFVDLIGVWGAAGADWPTLRPMPNRRHGPQPLLAENASRFREDVTIEAELFCDLEWQPSEADEASEIVAVGAERSVPR